MSVKSFAMDYSYLTPQERFCLLLAARGRGDDAECSRLSRTSKRITLTVQDHAPYMYAFDELALLVFMGLVEDAARYRDAIELAKDAAMAESEESDETQPDESSVDSQEPVDNEMPSEWELQLIFAAGYIFRTNAEGWRLFCEGMHLPPYLLWEKLPGYDRLRKLLSITERAAFASDTFLSWLNRVRPKDMPKLTENRYTSEGAAEAIDEIFERLTEQWGVHDRPSKRK